MKTLLALLLLSLSLTTASAGEPEPFSYRWYKRDAYWSQYYCGGEYRAEGCHRYRRWPRAHFRPAPNPDVMLSAQLRLRELGYDLDADGFMGPETREAVRRFQRQADLSVTGELDRETRQALREESASPSQALRCRSESVHSWSGQHNTEIASKADAQKRWMVGVQAKYGSIHMNFGLATSIRWRCFQSQSHDTILGKVQSGTSKILGGEGYFVVCELWAKPCAAPVESGEE